MLAYQMVLLDLSAYLIYNLAYEYFYLKTLLRFMLDLAVGQTESEWICVDAMGHFRVAVCLGFEVSLGAQLL